MAIDGLTADLRVADVLARWPAAMRYFIARRMACVGCSMAVFCSLRAVAVDYRIPIDRLMAELEACIEAWALAADSAETTVEGG